MFFNNMTNLSPNQLKQYENKGFVSPIDIFSKDKTNEMLLSHEKVVANAY